MTEYPEGIPLPKNVEQLETLSPREAKDILDAALLSDKSLRERGGLTSVSEATAKQKLGQFYLARLFKSDVKYSQNGGDILGVDFSRLSEIEKERSAPLRKILDKPLPLSTEEAKQLLACTNVYRLSIGLIPSEPTLKTWTIPESYVIKVLGKDYPAKLDARNVRLKLSELFFDGMHQRAVSMDHARLEEISRGIGTSSSNRSHD